MQWRMVGEPFPTKPMRAREASAFVSGVAFPRYRDELGMGMNLPNIITLSRIPLMFVIVGLMYCDFTGAATLAFWLFIAGAVGDWLDGYLARKQKLISNFGKLMDAMADKIMVLGIVIALVEKHEVWMVLALITLCREFLITAMRMVAVSKGVVVAADTGGKSKTMTQLIAIGFLLGGPMVAVDGTRLLHWNCDQFVYYVMKIGLWGFVAATVLSVWSGLRYISRNAAVVVGGESGIP